MTKANNSNISRLTASQYNKSLAGCQPASQSLRDIALEGKRSKSLHNRQAIKRQISQKLNRPEPLIQLIRELRLTDALEWVESHERHSGNTAIFFLNLAQYVAEVAQ